MPKEYTSRYSLLSVQLEQTFCVFAYQINLHRCFCLVLWAQGIFKYEAKSPLPSPLSHWLGIVALTRDLAAAAIFAFLGLR